MFQILDGAISRANEAKARCLAEQGYAFASDVFDGKRDSSRFVTSNAYLERALKFDNVDPDERTVWKITIGQNYIKMHQQLFRKGDGGEVVKYCTLAIRHFCELLNVQDASPILKAVMWMNLGTAVNRLDNAYDPRALSTDGFEVYLSDPEACFEEALSLSPANAEITGRYVRCLLHQGNNKKSDGKLLKALQLIEVVLKCADPPPYWLDYVTKADICMSRYSLQDWEGKTPDKTLLVDAEKCMKYVIDEHPSQTDVSRMAWNCHRLAMHDRKYNRGEIDDEHKNDALLYYKEALKCPVNDKYSYIHLQVGLCLLDYGEKRDAAESFKRTIEKQNENTKYTYAFYNLMMTLLQLYMEGNRNDPGLLDELVYWMDQGCERYKDNITNIAKDISDFFHEYWHDMTSVVVKLARNEKHNSVQLILSAIRGKTYNWRMRNLEAKVQAATAVE